MDNTGRRGQLAAPSRQLPPAAPPPPRTVVSAFLPCGGHGGQARRKIGSARLGGKVGHGNGEEAELGPAALPGGGMGFARALWMRIVTKVMSRRGSSVKERYAQEDYEQNFDEGDAAGEPENLPRSFSARSPPAFEEFVDVRSDHVIDSWV
uniref:Uncharacterized protein n=1 Tax=Aegilops tauschii TaxID=37682 RepID=R7W9M3_AEGTA